MEEQMTIIPIIGLVIALLGLPFTLSKYRNILSRELSKYNHKEKIILVTSITSIGLALALGVLSVLQFVNSIPTLFYIQTLSVHPTTYAFQDLMVFGIISGIICSFLGYRLLRTNLKELRIILYSNSFRKTDN